MMISGNLDAMGDALLAQARDEAQRVIAAAQHDADTVMHETEEEARRLIEAAVAQAEAETRLEVQRRLARAEVEAAHVLIQAREAIIQQAMDHLAQRIHALPDESNYVTVLEYLLREAVTGLGQPTLDLHVRKDDRYLFTEEWLARMGDELGITLHLSPEPAAIAGGLIVSTPDGRLIFDQSFDALMRRHEDVLRSIIAQVLWNSQQAKETKGQ